MTPLPLKGLKHLCCNSLMSEILYLQMWSDIYSWLVYELAAWSITEQLKYCCVCFADIALTDVIADRQVAGTFVLYCVVAHATWQNVTSGSVSTWLSVWLIWQVLCCFSIGCML